MLKYNIKLTDDNIRQERIVWGEKYLSPDLSFVSGVTSQDYHLEKLTKIAASNTISHTPTSILPINCENATRQGFAIIKAKTYDVDDGYLFLNGKYYYPTSSNTFVIDNWLIHTTGHTVQESTIEVESASTIGIDTIAWIEDGLVTIDGETYSYDNNLKALRMLSNEGIVEASGVTKCEGITFYPYDAMEYSGVTKFILTKSEEINEPFERLSFIKYYYYILYKNRFFEIYRNGNEINFHCDIPNEFLDDSSVSGISTFTVFREILNDDGDIEEEEVSGTTFDALINDYAFVKINDDKFVVKGDSMNANNGDKIGVYLLNAPYNINIGDVIRFEDISGNEDYYISSDENGEFVLFRCERFNVVDKLCDRIDFNGEEFDIEYVDDGDCLVHINDDLLRMEVDGDKAIQYGYVLSGTPVSATTLEYDIKHYSGITIDGINYPITNPSGITINVNNEYYFEVEDIRGSSMLICKPYLSSNDFSDEFIIDASQMICKNVVFNQEFMSLYLKNNIFGKRKITKDLALNEANNPISSDNYFNLFDNFEIYTANAYIHIPLVFDNPLGNNLIQDDIVKRDFYEKEKNKAINPIIDMEKDVYSPKYFNGVYEGSNTIFKNINEIRFNLHFRTRNLESWKVNEEYNNIGTSDLCNWFITDFYPYSESDNKDEILNSSDLIGLLGFRNDDVYFQKSKLSKTFLRLSFYDSTDEQTQMLLGTSTIFMNEHKLFKKYIDNSRKGLFGTHFHMVSESENDIISSKISVQTEYYVNDDIINEEHRLGSEFVVTNKYETNDSSDGFYIYMFREYSENLTPKPIYMKVEFNHAGYGRTIPFIIPMKWENGEDTYKYPKSALTLNDLDELKSGIKLEDSYAQSYIPLYAVYDFKHKQYGYVFDKRYVKVSDDGNVILNLFEIKFANDTDVNDDIQKEITYGKQPTAKIDINKDMFGDVEKECKR